MTHSPSAAGTLPLASPVQDPSSPRRTRRMAALAEAALRRGFPWLRFQGRLEQLFLVHYERSTRRRTRVAFLLAILLYALFGLVDRLLIPHAFQQIWGIRFLIVCPLLTLGMFLSRLPQTRPYLQQLLWFLSMVAGMGIIAMTAIDNSFGGKHYYSGLLLVIMFVFNFIGLRFWHSLTWGVATLAAYEATAILISQTPAPVLFYNSIVLISATGIGAISNYLLEHALRRDFLKTLLLEEEKSRLQARGAQYQRLSVLDELTGIANRRSLDQALSRETSRAHRHQRPLSVVLLDIDFFKEFNDHLGHQEGDRALQQVAALLVDFTRRPGDLAARYGGEEFALILPDTDAGGAFDLAESLREAVEGLQIPHPRSGLGPSLTISAGVGTLLPEETGEPRDLLEQADRALYAAKRHGRNRVALPPVAEPEIG